jgi:hypothetical protein
MRKSNLRGILPPVVILLVGFIMATEFNRLLGIRYRGKVLPEVKLPHAILPHSLPAFAGRIAAVTLPEGWTHYIPYATAAADLANGIETRTGERPIIMEESDKELPPGGIIAVGTGAAKTTPQKLHTPPPSAEGFSLQGHFRDGGWKLAITGGSPMGNVYGMYWLADALRGGYTERELIHINRTIDPAFRYRLVDMGAVGIVPDPAAWGHDYLHHTHAFQDAVLLTEPYVDERNFSRISEEFRTYLQRVLSYGYNGIVFDGFLEFINFDRVGNGREVYGPDSPYRKRHQVLRERFGELFQYAHSLGMKVVLATDMLPLTAPLERYLRSKPGGMDPSDPNLWSVYRAGLEELFDAFPSVDGIMIRIGEAGAIYNLKDWDYYSTLLVRTGESVRAMLQELLYAAEKKERKIFFRNWSVGIGEVGDVHTNPETYEKVLGDFHSPHLIVSTKYCMGDFFSFLPLNPTLMSGSQTRMVEFQARREFEGFGVLPNYMGPLQQVALSELRKRNPAIDGIWLWTQRGGPLHAGPLSLYPLHGFWILVDANVYTTARLAWDPEADIETLTESWIRKNFGDDPGTIHSLSQLLFLSRKAILKGFYVGDSALRQVIACGLQLPPTPWLWNMIGGSSSALSLTYFAGRDKLEQTLSEGFEAVDVVRQMKDLTQHIACSHPDAQRFHAGLMKSLEYEESLFDTLAWYRTSFLSYYHWLDTGDPTSLERWRESFALFQEKKRSHLLAYGKNLDFPAFDFVDADAGMAILERNGAMTWLARIQMVFLPLFLISFIPSARKPTPIGKEEKAFRMLRRMRTAFAGIPSDSCSPASCTATGLSFIFFIKATLIFSSFRSILFPAWTLLSLSVFTLSLRTFSPRGSAGWIPPLAATAGPIFGLAGLFMGVASIRGPLFFWYRFWTHPAFRILFVTLFIAFGLWLFFAVYRSVKTRCGQSVLPAMGLVLTAIGMVCVTNGLLAATVGLEHCLTALNNEMVILPLSLSKVLGITTHLNINPHLPLYIALCGTLAAGTGFLMRFFSKRHPMAH